MEVIIYVGSAADSRVIDVVAYLAHQVVEILLRCMPYSITHALSGFIPVYTKFRVKKNQSIQFCPFRLKVFLISIIFIIRLA